MENRTPRQVYIVPKGYDQEKAIEEAGEWNCPEIAWGIPPRLQNMFKKKDLPLVYIEPLPEPAPEPVDLVAEISDLKERVAYIEGQISMFWSRGGIPHPGIPGVSIVGFIGKTPVGSIGKEAPPTKAEPWMFT